MTNESLKWELIEKVKAGTHCIDFTQSANVKGLREILKVCFPEFDSPTGDVEYYSKSPIGYWWRGSSIIPEGVESIPLADFFESTPIAANTPAESKWEKLNNEFDALLESLTPEIWQDWEQRAKAKLSANTPAPEIQDCECRINGKNMAETFSPAPEKREEETERGITIVNINSPIELSNFEQRIKMVAYNAWIGAKRTKEGFQEYWDYVGKECLPTFKFEQAAEKEDTDLQEIVSGSFGIAMNANDFFNYACADMVTIDPEDLEWVIPIYQKYSWRGIDACMAFIAKQMPIKPHITKEFEEAYAEIEKINPTVHSEY